MLETATAGAPAPLPAPAPIARLAELAGPTPLVRVSALEAGYAGADVLRGFDLLLGDGQSVCLVGPNGAGKSTVLNAVGGLCEVRAGRVEIGGRDVTHVPAHARPAAAGLAYLLQDDSVFPDMTVTENLLLGGHRLRDRAALARAVESVFDRYPLLAERRHQPARVLSGGERRLLEISRALITDPAVLLVDEPSIGLDSRAVAMVFDVLRSLRREGRTVLMVEQNVELGLGFADLGYLMVAGRTVCAAPAAELLAGDLLERHFARA